MGKNCKILIIGAGIAGLSTAYYLEKEGFKNITILEKSNRTGGRIFSQQTPYGNIEIGAIIAPKWYKHFKILLRDLEYPSLKTPNYKVKMYFDLGDGNLENAVDAKTVWEGIQLLLKNLSILKSTSIYFPKEISKIESYDLLTKQLGKNARITKLLDSIIQGFCYPSIHYFPDELLLPLLKKIVFSGGINKGILLEDGNQSLVDHLVAKLVADIQLDKEVKYINKEKKTVATNNGTYHYDKLVFASLPGKILSINANKGNAVKFHIVTTKTNSTIFPKDRNDWGGIIKLNKYPNNGLNTVFINPLERIKSNNATFITHYVSDYTDKATSDDQIDKFIQEETRKYIPEFKIDEIVQRHTWEQTIPTLNAKDIDRIQREQGKYDIFYAGDYLGFPSMETAIYSGKRAASLLMQDKETLN